ncbi:hypothetical protein BJF93_00820 [Xaviernesmea oryzae]|uniref:Phosphodiester glycosidase domain-containing protein n=1 Tax=Xaviernesmea oryzae TaxID=464029 RepID=A0A1Q9B0K0_9HYPH|nr:phosphodiester glycosidase family protein [Xaviernesmea oryzae]OLP61507.1 hypothetical protein BJF93_00820 [Xaviernesmea oryzae]SEL67028.1 prepilin-type processing-associated H-X9-DG domain-containing protein [Xaviernesmea oryzae]
MRLRLKSLLGALWMAGATPVMADDACRIVHHAGADYAVCSFDPARDAIDLFHTGRDGRPFGGFSALARDLRLEGRALRFAMNAGMYEDDLSPVGLLVIGGRERKTAALGEGWGNFYLRPNGVFYLAGGKAGVMETGRFVTSAIRPDAATQSGPMLVIDGGIHPAFRPQSDSLQIRNGVGVDNKGQAVFVISLTPVRFYDFATLYRDQLDCANALFLDGHISSLYAPSLGRFDGGRPMGPILAVTRPMPGTRD